MFVKHNMFNHIYFLCFRRAGSVGKRGTGACRGRGAGGRGRGAGGRGRGAGGRGAGGRGAGGRGAQGQGSKRGNMTERNGDKRTKKRYWN